MILFPPNTFKLLINFSLFTFLVIFFLVPVRVVIFGVYISFSVFVLSNGVTGMGRQEYDILI